MVKRNYAAMTLGLVLIASLAGAALAASVTNEQLVTQRVAAMKEDDQVLRGAAALSGTAAVNAAATVLRNFTRFPSLFRPGSITDDSRATPKIWDNWPDFTARLAIEKTNAAAMLAAAQKGDRRAYTAAIDALRGQCSNCHLTYANVF